MTAYLAPQFDTQFFDGSTVAAGYKLYTYDSGTTTPKAVYSDQAGTVPHTNPIVLDANGRVTGQMWLGSGEYTFTLKTDADVLVKTWNDVAGSGTANEAAAYDAAIRSDLASTSDAAKGAGMLGANQTLSYPAGTVGEALFQGAVNLDWYSELVTGNDWTAALAAAVATGRSVYVPWRLASRTLTAGATFANDNQVIFGSGEGSRFVFTISGIMFNADGRTGCGVVGLRLDGRNVAGSITTYAECAFRSITSTRCFVRDCVLSGWAGSTLFFQDANACTVSNNTFLSAATMPLASDGFPTSDVTFWGSNTSNVVQGNRCLSGAAEGIDFTSAGNGKTSYGNTIIGNVVDGAKNYGIILYNGEYSTSTMTGTRVIGNTVRNIYGYYNNPATGNKDFGAGIYVLQAEGTIVTGNFLYNTNINTAGSALAPGAIGINGLSMAEVTGNVIDTPNWYGVFVADSLQHGRGTGSTGTYLPSGFVQVEGNNIFNSGKDGVYVTDKHKVCVIGNTIDTTTGSGSSGVNVIITNSTNYPTLKQVAVDANTVTRPNSSGILLTGTVDASVSSNQIDTTPNTGIYVDATGTTIVGNSINAATVRGIDLRSTGTNSLVSSNTVTNSTTGVLAGHRCVWGSNLLSGNTADWSGTYAAYQSAAPSTGTWVKGDRVLQLTATVGQPKAWVCTTTPATFTSEGNL